MEDDKIRELFEKYDPEMKSDFLFLERVSRGVDSVELIKKRNSEQLRRNRQAVAIAAVIGFVVGMAFATFMPGIIGTFRVLAAAASTVPDGAIVDSLSMLPWLMAGLLTVFAALCSYDAALALLRRGERVSA